MRVTKPTWYQWLRAIESTVDTAVARSGIKGVTMMGADSNLKVKTDTEVAAVKMPYCRILLVGRNYSDTHNKHLEKQYTLKSTAALDRNYDYNETLAFSIETFANKHQHALNITQSVVAYFGGTGTLVATKGGVDYEAPYAITNYALNIREEDTGNISYYSTELTLTLQVVSERTTDQSSTVNINKVIVEDDEELTLMELT